MICGICGRDMVLFNRMDYGEWTECLYTCLGCEKTYSVRTINDRMRDMEGCNGF